MQMLYVTVHDLGSRVGFLQVLLLPPIQRRLIGYCELSVGVSMSGCDERFSPCNP